MLPPVIYEVKGFTGCITLNRPEKRNALNAGMVAELKACFLRASTDDHIRVILLSGNEEAFCSGADLDELRKLQSCTYEQNLADSRSLMALYSQIYLLEKPVIARVEGPALAGGCGLILCCDLCYSTPTARFGFPEVRIGFIPALVSVFLVRRIGEPAARELLLTGRPILAARAAEIKLITGIFPKDRIREEMDKIAEDLSGGVSAHAIKLTKKLLASGPGMPLEDALEYAAVINAQVRSSEDCKKGIAAFLKGEKLQW